MLRPWTFLIAAHAIAATLALILGPVQVLRRTKGDSVHKVVGRVWAGLMLFVAAGSFLFGGYSGGVDIFLRVLAGWTLFSVTMGLIRARRGNIPGHRGMMVGTYIGLIGAFIGVLAVHDRRVPSWFSAHPLGMSLVAVILIAIAGTFVAAVLARYRSARPVAPTV